MKQKKRRKVLSVLMVITLLLLPITAQADSLPETTVTQPRVVVQEDVTRREVNVKHFQMSDNSYQAVVFDSPVHY